MVKRNAAISSFYIDLWNFRPEDTLETIYSNSPILHRKLKPIKKRPIQAPQESNLGFLTLDQKESTNSQNWNVWFDKPKSALSSKGLCCLYFYHLFTALTVLSCLNLLISFSHCMSSVLVSISAWLLTNSLKLGTLNTWRDYIHIYWAPGMCILNGNNNIGSINQALNTLRGTGIK